jgi:outer membrane protein TolC
VCINQGVVVQAEWNTVYSITRNYFSVQYARKQAALTRGLVQKLKDYRDKANLLVNQGDPDSKVTTADVDKLAVNIELYQLKVIEAEQGELRALVALREAMGLEAGCPLILEEELPLLQAVPCQSDLLALALSRRGEMIQANNAAQVVWLEVQAQSMIRSIRAMTFAAGSDIHARPVPTGDYTETYRPAALGLEMPPHLIGQAPDRMQRAQEFAVRAGAVVAKTRQLISLELSSAYLRWQEAARKLETLQDTPEKAIKVLKTTEDRFEIGGVTGEEMLRTKLLAEQVQAEYNIAAYMHALALVSLERITAGGFVPAYRVIPGPLLRVPATGQQPNNGERQQQNGP